jgi:hypothetical protein
MGIQAILTLPETDPMSKFANLLADNLKGDLLMLHGMVDDNVEL